MIQFHTIDYVFIGLFFGISLVVGLWFSKKSSQSSQEYFLSGRTMPWWLLGFSMVATTFSTDTPNLVTNIVRSNGVAGNWVWWAFLLTGLLTVFVYAKLWRRSGVNTDIEFYEMRYGGKPARFLRAFRALYLGLAFNLLAMAAVTLAAIKIGQVMLGMSPLQVVGIAGAVTVIFSTAGGFKGVVYTDFILFIVAMFGSVAAAYYCVNLPEIGGLGQLFEHEAVKGKLSLLPSFSDRKAMISLLIIPLAVQWWSAWYPGAEPGGGGYIAQRMLAAKDENHAIGATFFFNIMHYALRPWPWIIVALCSLVLYPDIASLKQAFPHVADNKLGEDLAYSAMMTKLPNGLVGIVLASLTAAYMSTISTHLNWGASYIVNDFYGSHLKQDATEKEKVNVGRIATVVLMVVSALLALSLNNALELFELILMFGAGTGLIFILRWFWWRINAWSELAAMLCSGFISLLFNFSSVGRYLFGGVDKLGQPVTGIFASEWKYVAVVLVTTLAWLVVTFFTKPEQDTVLEKFYVRTRPGGPGWKRIVQNLEEKKIAYPKQAWSVPIGLLATLLGCLLIYGLLFATGYWIYGEYASAMACSVLAIIMTILLVRMRHKIKETL